MMLRCVGIDRCLLSAPSPNTRRGCKWCGVKENKCLLAQAAVSLLSSQLQEKTTLNALAWLFKRVGSFLASDLFIHGSPVKPRGHVLPFILEDGAAGVWGNALL